ncbi:MAG: gamma-glutamyltransferase [Parvibaculales bacterium]
MRPLSLGNAIILTLCLVISQTGRVGAQSLITPGNEAMVAAAHPLAAQTGRRILEAGGTAMDAAVAVQAVLGLVEPQSSGLAGGGFLLHYQADNGELTSWDGREIAPANLDKDIFDQYARPRSYENYMRAVTSAHATGVPGIPDLLVKAHSRFGKLDWPDLLAPASTLSRKGFAVTPRLHILLQRDSHLRDNEQARALFYRRDETGRYQAVPIGHIIKNPAYAETLDTFARQPRAGFYGTGAGTPGHEILTTLTAAGNSMTAADLAAYSAKQRSNLCARYRTFKVCSMGPPSSGGMALLQMLGILSHFKLSELSPDSVTAVHLISEAGRLAFADRNHYLADPDFVDVPVAALLETDYLRRRAGLININRAMPSVTPGDPAGTKSRFSAARSPEMASTTHFTIRDFSGNIVSFTSSVESAFGSRRMAGGMMLNNQLTDFSFASDAQDKPAANAPAGGKRPRSSMTPVIIFDAQNKPFAALGSPGGPKIIGYVALSVIALLDWGMSMQEAIALPRHVAPSGTIELEAGTPLSNLAPVLEQMGHKTKINRHHSGLHGIRINGSDGLDGGADPRREGVVMQLKAE